MRNLLMTAWESILRVIRRGRATPSDKLLIVVNRGRQRISIRPDEFDTFEFQSGDRLTIHPRALAARLAKTPDGSKHILVGDAKAIRVPPRYDLAEFKGFKLPVHLVILTGAGPESLESIGTAHIRNYEKFMGLRPDMTLLEIGCGVGRDAMQLIGYLSPAGRYIGVDVTRDSIEWCRRNISTLHPNFDFYHFDAEHELYNPLGSKTSLDFGLPAQSGTVDRVFLGSVFTHLFEDEIVHYMKEIRRILRPNGLAYATFFRYSPEIIAAAVRTNLTPFGLSFQHGHGDGCYINDAAYPTGAVAYTDDAMLRMIDTAGLKLVRPYLRGWWSGYFDEADDGQDVAILTPR